MSPAKRPLDFSLEKVIFALNFESKTIKYYTAETIVRSIDKKAIIGKAYLTLEVFYKLDKTVAHAYMVTSVIFNDKTSIMGIPCYNNCLFSNEMYLVLPESGKPAKGMLTGTADAFFSSEEFSNIPASTKINIYPTYWDFFASYSNVNLANL